MRITSLAVILVGLATPAMALDLNALVAKHAAANGVPESLVRRVIRIESRGQPQLISKGNYGLMQIRYGTAKAMGYTGTPQGLLDADTNMTYAVRYLAGAYRVANGNADRAIHYYQRGYYAEAKAKHVSPYRLASQTSMPIQLAPPHTKPVAAKLDRPVVAASDKPAAAPVEKLAVAKPDKPAVPVETVAIAVSDRPATLAERFAVATSPVKPAAAPVPPAPKPVKVIAISKKPAVSTKPATAAVKHVARPKKLAVVAPVQPAMPETKLAVIPPVKPLVLRNTMAAAPPHKSVTRHRRAKAANKPFNLLAYLETKLTGPATKPVRGHRHHRVHSVSAAPMRSAATARAQKP